MSNPAPNQELIYSQDDMNPVLKAVQKYKKEAEHSHQLLYAVLKVTGEVGVPYDLWLDWQDGDVREIIMRDDEKNRQLRLKVKPDEV